MCPTTYDPLIQGATEDNGFVSVCKTREDEAIGMVAGAWMAGMRGCALMQTSGFAMLPNVIASLIVPYQIPAILIVPERGTMGEFNIGRSWCRDCQHELYPSRRTGSPGQAGR